MKAVVLSAFLFLMSTCEVYVCRIVETYVLNVSFNGGCFERLKVTPSCIQSSTLRVLFLWATEQVHKKSNSSLNFLPMA